MTLWEAVRECLVALSDEIRAVREQGSRPVYLYEGHFLAEREGFYIYTFTADSELRIPDDSRVELEPESSGEACGGFLLTAEGFEVLLALEEDLGDQVRSARLRTAPWFLLEELQERLRELKERDLRPHLRRFDLLLSSYGEELRPPELERAERLLRGMATAQAIPLKWNEDQLRAVGQVLANPISFIWGPPGTGKTTTLGLVATALVAAGESLLITAHSNVAVDVAMISVTEKLPKHPIYLKGGMLRVGPPALRELEAFPQLHIRGVLQDQEPELVRRLERLEGRKRLLIQRLRSPRGPRQRRTIERELHDVREELQELEAVVREAERELIAQARVIGCTLSKAAITPEIYEREFDAVLLDEASMAYIPQGLLAAGLATRRLAVFGDFRQLPPIAQANTSHVREWLRRDLFEKAGVVERLDRGDPDPRVVLLRTQYRMHPHISALCNALFYGGRLRDGPEVEAKTRPFAQLPPSSGEPLVLGELPLYAFCTLEKETHSRFNLISALAVVHLLAALLREAPKDVQVGVITPYVAQTRLLRKMLEDADLVADPKRVTVATVHRFQGSEREVILVDLTEGPPLQPSVLLQGREAARLANVALSRARGKSILLAQEEHLGRLLPVDNPFRRLIERVGRRSRLSVDPRTWWGLPGLQVFPSPQRVQEALIAELSAAQEEILLAWPPGHSLSPVYEGLCRVGPSVDWFVRWEADRERTEHSLGRLGLGAERLYTLKAWPKELPLGLVGIDRRALWVLVDLETAAGPVLRIEWPQTLKLLIAFWGLLPQGEARRPTLQERQAEGAPFGRCPRCGEPLWPQGAQMVCANRPRCSYARAITPREATDWAKLMNKRCPRCGGPLVGRQGRYSGVFLGCSNYPRCTGTRNLRDI